MNTFVENVSDQDSNSDQLQYFLETLQFIPDIQISPSQLECLTYVAGYAVFSYMKKTNICTNCYNYLTTDKQMELLNDVGSQYILVDSL